MKLVLKNSSLHFQKYKEVGNLYDGAKIYLSRWINNADTSSAAIESSGQFIVAEIDVSKFPVGTVFYTWSDAPASIYGRNYAFFTEDNTWTHGSKASITESTWPTKTSDSDAILRITFRNELTTAYIGVKPYSET